MLEIKAGPGNKPPDSKGQVVGAALWYKRNNKYFRIECFKNGKHVTMHKVASAIEDLFVLKEARK